MPVQLSDLRSDFTLTPDYLNLALNNMAQSFIDCTSESLLGSLTFQPFLTAVLFECKNVL